MKYLKKKEKKSKLPIVLLCIVLILAAGAAALYFYMGGLEETPGETQGQTEITAPTHSETMPPETESHETQPGEAALQEVEVVTDYGTFLLSGYWHGQLRAEVTGDEVCTISVYGQIGAQQEQHIFDVHFGGNEGETVGFITDENGRSLAVHIVMSDFEPDESWTEMEEQEYYGMQSEVNSIIGSLELSDAGETDTEDLLVETPYMTLAYPGTWGDRIRTEVSGDSVVTVRFYGTPAGMEEQYLFELILGGDGENAVGIYTAQDGQQIPVEITAVSDGPGEGWDAQAAMEMNAMIEGINYILSALESSGNFNLG